MVVLISDLHLADRTTRQTIDVRRLLAHLERVIHQAHENGVRRLTLVLLGDIFEILKSTLWLQQNLRPWESCTVAHTEIVKEITQRIVLSNRSFFETLSRFMEKYRFLELVYIPGNHDRPLNTEMGVDARVLLGNHLPVALSKNRFPENVTDNEHRLFAQHGHEWDPDNRYGHGFASYGDAVVLEFILSLPFAVTQELGIGEDDPLIDFLYEIDNVRPSGLKTILQWIDERLPEVRSKRPELAAVIESAIDESHTRLGVLRKQFRFESIERTPLHFDFLNATLRSVARHLGYRKISKILPVADDEAQAYAEFALSEFETGLNSEDDCRFIVCGHTHNPALVPLVVKGAGKDRVRFYVNTGTWRRVHRAVRNTDRKEKRSVVFASSDEECLVTISSDQDQKLGYPPYEFYRLMSATT